jgi:dipeptidyl-peptidase-4
VRTGNEEDIYFPRIKWTEDPNKLCIMKLNRHQNHLEFLLSDNRAKSTIIPTNPIYEERSKTYIEINDNLIFSENGNGFYWNSEQSGYNHIYYFSIDGKTKNQITDGNWDVIDFYGVDEKNRVIYYSSSQESAIEKHIYAKSTKGRYFEKLSTRAGTNSAVFSKTFKYYINYHSSASTPPYITMHNSKGKELRVLKDNMALSETLRNYELQEKEFFTFTNSSGDELNCWMIKPQGFQSRQQYPVLVTIYGGPGRNTVTDSWGGSSYLWHQMLAQQGYLVVSCDPRGTQYRGREFKHSTYMELGKLETEDFIDLAIHLKALPYVDGERIGMQGWSYGGYMTSLCMTKGAAHYSAGIAVAPVTNWRYYDTIYTERFMRTPQENPSGYDDNSPINHVEKLEGNYLLVHGSADDNVHYQNTMEMIDALVKANKQFDLFIYPNKNHGIYGGTTRLHLFNKMTDFLKENL